MIVKETKDSNEIKKVLCHPEIYSRISDDNCPSVDEFEPPISDEYQYVAGYVNGDIIGLMVYYRVTGGIKCHLQVLPEYRGRYAVRFARIALKFGKAKNAVIYSEIPTCYPDVISFAKYVGFKELGSIEKDYMRDGVSYDSMKLRKDNVVC